MYYDNNWAVVVPMANEENDFASFIEQLTAILNRLGNGTVYLVVDMVSTDNTLNLCRELSQADNRFATVWAPENRNVVDAYMRGYKEAFLKGHDIIMEMDAGLSHDPRAIPMFLRVLNEGNECAFGSRFINGGSMADSPFRRRFLSRGGSFLANLLLGTKLHDMTSGFQGYHSSIVGKLIEYKLFSTAHFYQTEVRYLLRNYRFAEVPIHYKAPSPRVSRNALRNAFSVLAIYFWSRITGQTKSLYGGAA